MKIAKQRQPTFRGAAQTIQQSRDFEIILHGPAETGKTFAALWHVDSFLRDNAGAVGVIVRKTRESLYITVLRTYDKILVLRGNDVKPYGGLKPEWYDYPNGSRLYVSGLDKADRLLSGEFDIIYGNQVEDFTLADWEILTTRATGRASNAPYTQVLGDCNPSTPSHWILQRSSLTLLPSYHKDNPRLYNADGTPTPAGLKSLDILSKLTGVRALRLYKGLWSVAEGAVYPEFTKDIHAIPAFDPPREWIRIASIDFGYNNPTVVQYWAISNDGDMYLYREIYATGMLVEDVAREMQRLEQWYTYGNQRNPQREPIAAYIADHDSEDRATLARYGIATQPAFKGIKLGIEAVQTRLRLDNRGKPRLYLMADTLTHMDMTLAEEHKPTSTLDEIEAYSWPKSKPGKSEDETPVKKDDHGMDAMRYAVCYVDNIGAELENETVIIIDEALFDGAISPF